MEEEAVEAVQLLRSLASSSMTCSVPQFPVKWQSIRDKLQQLCSSIDAGGSSDEHLTLPQFLQSALTTVSHVQAIASQCSDGSYAGGRLRLRSELDNIGSRLDAHIGDLKEMASSRIAAHSQAIIAARPAVDASVDDKAFYLNNLFCRMSIGSSVQRSQALATIGELLSEDDECVKIVALDIDDSTALLTGFLESGDACIQEEAVGAVSIIAGFNSYRGVLVKAGAIAPLVQLLESASSATVSAKERAAQALRELTENSNNVWAVCAHGGLDTLLQACASVDGSSKLVSSAFAVLKNLSRVDEVKMFMVEQRAVSELVKLSQQKEEVRKLGSIDLLHSIALDDDDVRQEAVSMGVIHSILQLINPDLPYSYRAREVALAAIRFFCFSSANLLDDLISSSFLDWLLFYLNNGEYAILECTLKILKRHSEISEEYNRMIGRAGFMTALASLLGAKSSRVREAAAQVLCNLLLLHPNRLIFIQDDDNINQLLQLLDHHEGKLKDMILSAVMSLADTNNGRKKIVSSEHFSSLKELADSGDFNAKKIIKKLSTNRLQNILSKIWSA